MNNFIKYYNLIVDKNVTIWISLYLKQSLTCKFLLQIQDDFTLTLTRNMFYDVVFCCRDTLSLFPLTTSFEYTQNLQILHHYRAHAIWKKGMRRRGAEDVELDKITPVRILGEASASESRFLRLLPRVFPIRRPSFPRFLRPFFIILARTGSSKRFVMREKEIERDKKRKK